MTRPPFTPLPEQAAPSPESAPPVRLFETDGGLRLYAITVPAFLHLRVHCFVVVQGPPQAPTYTALVDVGSAEEKSLLALKAGMTRLREEFGENVGWDTLDRIVLTHAHPDHIGGLNHIRTLTDAPLAAHSLAVREIEEPGHDPELARQKTEEFLAWSGITGNHADRMRRRAGRGFVAQGEQVRTVLEDGDGLDGIFTVLHTPGHSRGQICLRLGNLLLSADQLLARNLPPLLSQQLAPGDGLAAYLRSLDKLEALTGIDTMLGSHDEPMNQWRDRIARVREKYAQKLHDLRELAAQPQTVAEFCRLLNPRMTEAQAILLLDQTAALVEYLLEQGQLREVVENGQGKFTSAGTPATPN